MSGQLQIANELRKRQTKPGRMSVFTVEPRVIIDNKASNRYTVIEVNGRDRLGFLFSVCEAFYKLSLQVYSAKISTFGEQVVDVFYVQDLFGTKIDQPGKITQIKKVLISALESPVRCKFAVLSIGFILNSVYRKNQVSLHLSKCHRLAGKILAPTVVCLTHW